MPGAYDSDTYAFSDDDTFQQVGRGDSWWQEQRNSEDNEPGLEFNRWSDA
jgi:hypothetical protein